VLTKEAIQELAQAEAINSARVAIDAAVLKDEGHALAALPSDFKLLDLEGHMPLRRRARGKMTTAVLAHFAAYVNQHKQDGATVFVEKQAMNATAVLNLGTPEKPGHADNTATLALQATAAYLALNAILQRSQHHGLTQRELAEFMEDWAPATDMLCETAEGATPPVKHAIDAVRKVTIDTATKRESVEGQLSAERSDFERVAASSGGNPLPAFIRMSFEPFHGIARRSFVLRLGVRTDGAIKLTLRLVKAEEHAEEMAVELAGKVTDAIGTAASVYVGSYSAK
jgi:uncharacterized protein YfdQ (DUF2303 family)